MRLETGSVNVSNVAKIIGKTLGIAIVLDLLTSHFLGWRIPWYSTTAVLTLFMYACESDLAYQNRVAEVEWAETTEKRLGKLES